MLALHHDAHTTAATGQYLQIGNSKAAPQPGPSSCHVLDVALTQTGLMVKQLARLSTAVTCAHVAGPDSASKHYKARHARHQRPTVSLVAHCLMPLLLYIIDEHRRMGEGCRVIRHF